MIRTILPGKGDTSGIMIPLIPFDMIIDTDVGLICTILKKYMNSDVFIKEFFNKKICQLVYDLYLRKVENPLRMCLKEQYIGKADIFYEQFMEQEYDSIINYSVFTEFYRLIRAYTNETDIRPTILYKNERERIELLKHENTKKCTSISVNCINASNIKNYNQFYFKRIEDVTPFLGLIKNKTIYFANYGFNKNDDGNIKDNGEIFLLSEDNVINIIDVYSMNKLEEAKNG